MLPEVSWSNPHRIRSGANPECKATQPGLASEDPLVSVLSLTSLSFSSISSVALTTVLGVGKRIPIYRGAENGHCLVHVHRTT